MFRRSLVGRQSFAFARCAGPLLAGAVALASWSSAARADCTPGNPGNGATVTCAVPGTAGLVAGAGVDGLTINVQPGATVTDNGLVGIQINSNNTVTNNGSIIAGDNAAGIAINTTLPGPFDNNTVVNNGFMQAGINSTAIFLDSNGAVTNNGTIQLGNSFSTAIDVLDNVNIFNGGWIVAPAGSDPVTAIRAEDSNTIQNNGWIVLPGTHAIAIDVRDSNQVVNNGTISVGDNGVGIKARDNSPNIMNNGTIIVGSGADAGGIVLRDSNIAINNGTIITGAGATAVALRFNNVFTNNGSLQAGALGYAIFPSAGLFQVDVNTITNNGTIDGRILLPGGTNTVTNSGLLTITNPGTPVGTLADLFSAFAISGDYIQTATGTLAIRVTPDNTVFDRLGVDTATLAGTLRAVVQPGLYGQTTVYPGVVTTSCGCVGNFDRAVSSSPFFTASTAIDFTDVDLTLTRIAFNAVPNLTPNQLAVANALQGAYSTNLTGSAATFFGNLLAATSVNVLDQLSGQGTTAVQTASLNTGALFNTTMQNQALLGGSAGGTSITVPSSQYAESRRPRGQEAFASLAPTAEPPADQAGRWRVWTLGFGASRSVDGTASLGIANQTMRNYGGALGADYRIGSDLLVGFSAGGSEASVSVPTLSTNGQITAGHLGVYGVKTWGPLYGAATVSYARLDNSTTRNIVGIGPSETATGRFAGDQLSGRFELGWKQALATMTLTPFVAIEPAALWAHSYTESSTLAGGGAGILGLHFAAHTTTSLPTFLGMQVDTRAVLSNGTVLTPYARASWIHEFLPDRSVTATFVNVATATFSVDGARAASDAARLDAGTKLAIGSGASLFANLSGEWSGISQSYAAAAGFQLVR